MVQCILFKNEGILHIKVFFCISNHILNFNIAEPTNNFLSLICDLVLLLCTNFLSSCYFALYMSFVDTLCKMQFCLSTEK